MPTLSTTPSSPLTSQYLLNPPGWGEKGVRALIKGCDKKVIIALTKCAYETNTNLNQTDRLYFLDV